MSENLKKFLALIANNKELEAKALACNELGEEKGKEALLALAKECGIELTAADFEKKEKSASGELSDDELDAVAGGGGGGTDSNDGRVYGCACVGYGQGGDGRASDMNCICPAFGTGFDDEQFTL